jgi:hypothetical protein
VKAGHCGEDRMRRTHNHHKYMSARDAEFQLNDEKTAREAELRGTLQNGWPGLFRSAQGHENKG